MVKRVLVIMMLALVVVGATVVLAHEGHDGDPVRGAALYAEFCLACHGPQGEARADHEAFATAVTYNTEFAETVAQGVAGSQYMLPWGEAHGGPLSEDDILDIQAYAQTWQTEDFEPPLSLAVSEDLTETQAQGAELFLTNCAGCHGRTGQGRDLAGFPAISPYADVLTAARRGVSDSAMPPFAGAHDGPLSEEQLDSIMAYVRTWERPVEMAELANAGPKGAWQLILGIGLFGLVLVGGAVLTRRNS